MEQLTNLKRWLASVASRYAYETDDLVQEGLIVIWEILQKTPDASLSYLKRAAILRFSELAYHNSRPVGSEGKRGQAHTRILPVDAENSIWDRMPPEVLQ